eukprot:CAMPEP_0183726316 /NCGR_PEP_ID=MMETSP0737-20130205/23048_1 /TAXON_ID=385413 /ORGANISM="Thalassiosira miniscula, Strain CCMP1093" /LENGTH=661 /DNA_ID=CAMNT_0025957633 /DNA_START=7 /DNA_END=1992 /DNA_ORIENTATION=-
MARGIEDAEYGLEEEDEHHSLIELSAGERRRTSKQLGTRSEPLPSRSSGSGSSSTTCRWATILFLLVLAGVYHLGLQEGKNEVKKQGDEEDVERKEPSHSNVQGIDGGGGDEAPVQAPKPADPTPPPVPSVSFTLERLKAVREESQKLITMLEEYYPSKEATVKMLMQAFVAEWDFDATEEDGSESRARADKLIDTMARALVTDDQDTFLMGGIGSSVMAGHDNCHYDSYQSQMERLWAPVWEAAGMKFVFQNAGEGGGCGDSFQNQHFCVKQNVSPDVDIVHYSWTYFEGGRAAPEHEDLLRWIQMLPKQPPLHIFNTGKLDKGMDGELTKHYAKYAFNSFYMSTAFRNGGYDYDAEKTREKDPIDRFGWGVQGDGYHDTTRYGENEQDEARKASLGVNMRNWHPGPMGFQLTSDAFTYVYTQAILKALDLIEKDFNDGNDPRKTWSASERPMLMKDDLPEPKQCDPEYCQVDEAPGCLNYELPTYGLWGPRVEDPEDDLNPYKGEPQNWSIWHQNNDLWYMVGKQDTAVFRNREDKEICRHLDACGGISAQKKEDGMVVFRLPKMEVGLVFICMCCGKKVAQEQIMENPNIEISYNTVTVEKKDMDYYPIPNGGKCVQVMKRFPTSGRQSETPTGHHYMAIKVLNDMPQPVRISHVVTL